MTKQEEIQAYVRGWLKYAQGTCDDTGIDFVLKNMTEGLHTQGLIIKVAKDLPVPQKDNIKLSELKEVIDRTVAYAGTTNPRVEFWVGDHEYELEGISQFSILPDVTVTLKDAKAGFTAYESLIQKDKKEEDSG